MQCPKCHVELANNASYCGCGWRDEPSSAEPPFKRRMASISGPGPDPVLGYIRCEWVADGRRCRYPGSMSRSTAPGAWMCSAHWRCNDPLLGADIVEASQSYKQLSRAEIERCHQLAAEAKCQALNLTTTARKRAWVLEQVHKLAQKWDARQHYGREPGE